MRIPVVLIALVALAGCGQKVDLRPEGKKPLPVAPYGRDERPSSEALMKAPIQAIPERRVELRTRSEERQDDPFDLPPGEE